MTSVFQITSVLLQTFLLPAMAYERYILICHSAKAKVILSLRNRIIMVALIAVVALGIEAFYIAEAIVRPVIYTYWVRCNNCREIEAI